MEELHEEFGNYISIENETFHTAAHSFAQVSFKALDVADAIVPKYGYL